MRRESITLHLEAEGGELLAVLSELSDACRLSSQVGQGLVRLLGQGLDGSAVDTEGLVTARADGCRIFLEPSELLLALLAAVRAGKVDFEFLRVHGSPRREA